MAIRDDIIATPIIQIPINFTGSGDQTLIAGASLYKIAVLQFFFVASAAVVLTYKSGATSLSGPMSFVANGAQVQDFIQLPLSCNEGDAFVVNASALVTLGGTIWYARAPAVR